MIFPRCARQTMSPPLGRILITAFVLLTLNAPHIRAEVPTPAEITEFTATLQRADELYRNADKADNEGLSAEAAHGAEGALKTYRQFLAPDDARILKTQNLLAISYRKLGRLAEALKLAEEVLAMRRRTLGTDHSDTLASMNNIAVVYGALGQHTEALLIKERTLDLTRRKYGPDDLETFQCMNNLANTYSRLGRFSEALKLREETFEGKLRMYGPENRSTLVTMHNLAVSYRQLGRHDEAINLEENALALRRRTLPRDHPSTFYSMSNLAVSYNNLGRYDEARKLNEETLALRRRILGPEHPETLRSMGNLADTYRALNRRPEALTLRRDTLSLLDRMADTLTALTRDERSTALAQYQSYYTDFARLLAQDPQGYPEAFSVSERGKARSLLEELTARQAIHHSGIPAAAGERMIDLRNRIEALDGKLAIAPNDAARQPLRSARDSAKAELSTLRSDLMARFPRYAALSAVKTVSLDAGRDLLAPRTAFVSWLFDAKMQGIALALPKTGALQVLASDPGQALVSHAESYRWLHALPDNAAFRKALRDVPLAAWMDGDTLSIGSAEHQPAGAEAVPAASYERLRPQALVSHGRWLSETLLVPLADSIGDAEQWILSPDGILATLPWDTLPWQGKTLGEQKQLTVIQSLSVYQLLKEREAAYARDRLAGQSTQPLLAMGGSHYSNDAVQQCGVRSPNFQRAPVSGGGAKISTDPYATMRGLNWPNLPCTTNEVGVLHQLLGGKQVLGEKASEATLRQLSQSGELAEYQNLHFAAHGYLNTHYPNLSALVLTKTGTDELNDGFITAGEWPGFDLKSDLMVMSACETGLGKMVSGEGVQGLPYALYVAGNRDTLLSLWQVSDDGTALFMQRFWAKVKAGTSHARALSETKREMQRGEAGQSYSDPYYWAPFVLYGVQE